MTSSSLLLFAVLLLSVTAEAARKTTYWGPVVLSEGKRFEICANAAYSEFNVNAQVSFVRVADGAAVAEGFRLDPGQGGCTALSFERAGEAPVFALLEVESEPGDEDLVASAAIINGVFESPEPRDLLQDNGQRAITAFGPLRLLPGKRLQVCVHNPRNFAGTNAGFAIPVTIAFFRTNNSSEPFSLQSGELEPGEGSCVSVDEKLVGDRSFYAEVWSDPVEPGFSNPAAISGAFIINGVFEEPIPPSAIRFVD
jgi:hypothetical protein